MLQPPAQSTFQQPRLANTPRILPILVVLPLLVPRQMPLHLAYRRLARVERSIGIPASKKRIHLNRELLHLALLTFSPATNFSNVPTGGSPAVPPGGGSANVPAAAAPTPTPAAPVAAPIVAGAGTAADPSEGEKSKLKKDKSDSEKAKESLGGECLYVRYELADVR